MASIRRTLSPVPRAGAMQNGEAHLVASPLSKSSSCSLNHAPSGGLSSSLLGLVDSHSSLYRIHSVVLGFFSHRSSRPLERSKSKGQSWRRAFLHFFICFMVGIFIGFTPFVSMSFSINLVSKHQAFSFDLIPPARNEQLYDGTSRNEGSLIEIPSVKDNCSMGTELKGEDMLNGISDNSSVTDLSFLESDFVHRKLLIVVTPTQTSPFQAYYLNRLAHTLRLVPPPMLWIVVEMSAQSTETADILRRMGVMYRHLVCDKNLTSIRDRRVHQRNIALSHIETHRLDGIVYFADYYNMYSVDLFAQLREIRRFGTWPIALLMQSKNKALLEGPVCNGSQIIGWHTNDRSRRFQRFYADMSGFAFNSTIIWDPKRWHRPTLEPIRQLDTVKGGSPESTFIEQVVEDESQMEGLLLNCSRIMVWHLHLEASHPFYPHGWLTKKNLDAVVPLS